jgi:hypothetical protein
VVKAAVLLKMLESGVGVGGLDAMKMFVVAPDEGGLAKAGRVL